MKHIWVTAAAALGLTLAVGADAGDGADALMKALTDHKPTDNVLVTASPDAEETLFIDRANIIKIKDGFYAVRTTVFNGSKFAHGIKSEISFGYYYCHDGVMRDRSAKEFGPDGTFLESYVLKPMEVAPDALMKPVFDYVCTKPKARAKIALWSSLESGQDAVVEADRRYGLAHPDGAQPGN